MATYTVKVEWRGLDAIKKMMEPKAFKNALEEGLTDAALDVEGRAKANAPVATGHLASTIRVYGQLRGPTRTIIAGDSSTRYAVPVHEGSGLYGPNKAKYPIRPRTKRFLAFPSQRITTERFGPRAKLTFRKSGKLSNRSVSRYGTGAYVVTRLVMHPGVRPRPFLKDALFSSPIAEIIGRQLHLHFERNKRTIY